MDIISAYREVGSYRGAAAICETTPKSVRRVIARHEAGGVGPERKPRERNYDPVAELVTGKIAATKGRMSAKRLLPLAVAAGYEGSGRNFRRLVAAAKTEWRRTHHRGRRPAVWTPGEQETGVGPRPRGDRTLPVGMTLTQAGSRTPSRQPRRRGPAS
jgi:hypothetical protein